jgi:hypothetical protein
MKVFEVVPGLFIGTRLAETVDNDSFGVDVVIGLGLGLGMGPIGPHSARSS